MKWDTRFKENRNYNIRLKEKQVKTYNNDGDLVIKQITLWDFIKQKLNENELL